MIREPCVAESREFIWQVRPFDEALHTIHAGVRQIEDGVPPCDQSDANVAAGCSRKPAQFH
jgi:hypothetical protein